MKNTKEMRIYMKERKIQDLTEKEFSDLFKKNLTKKECKIQTLAQNQIEVSGVIVSSQKNSLREVEECANRLIDRHKDFLIMRKSNQLKTGYIG